MIKCKKNHRSVSGPVFYLFMIVPAVAGGNRNEFYRKRPLQLLQATGNLLKYLYASLPPVGFFGKFEKMNECEMKI
jgi:hypothetical protein